IIAATKPEIQPARSFLKKEDIPAVFCGVGLRLSVYAITRAILKHQPGLVIQAGIAGWFDRQIPLGSVLAVSKEAFGDIGVLEQQQWRSVFDLGLLSLNERPFKEGWLANPYKKLLTGSGLRAVPGISMNEVSTNKSRIRMLASQDAVIESMEGAALHYVALMERVPFLQIRAVSNYAGERDKRKWNFGDSIGNLNRELVRIVTQVTGN